MSIYQMHYIPPWDPRRRFGSLGLCNRDICRADQKEKGTFEDYNVPVSRVGARRRDSTTLRRKTLLYSLTRDPRVGILDRESSAR